MIAALNLTDAELATYLDNISSYSVIFITAFLSILLLVIIPLYSKITTSKDYESWLSRPVNKKIIDVQILSKEATSVWFDWVKWITILGAIIFIEAKTSDPIVFSILVVSSGLLFLYFLSYISRFRNYITYWAITKYGKSFYGVVLLQFFLIISVIIMALLYKALLGFLINLAIKLQG
jgi:hypothetical protein